MKRCFGTTLNEMGRRDGDTIYQTKGEEWREEKVVVVDIHTNMGPRCFCMGCRMLFSMFRSSPALNSKTLAVGPPCCHDDPHTSARHMWLQIGSPLHPWPHRRPPSHSGRPWLFLTAGDQCYRQQPHQSFFAHRPAHESQQVSNCIRIPLSESRSSAW